LGWAEVTYDSPLTIFNMRNKITLPIFLAAAILGGCKSSTTVENDDLGTLTGKIALIGLNCDSLANRAGATVAIEGTGFSTQTDSTGHWTIKGIPAGIYNIIISKPGFDTDLVPEYNISGVGTQFLVHEVARVKLMDSVIISSISATVKDSIRTFYVDSIQIKDTNGHIDTSIIEVPRSDTAYREYDLSVSFALSGPDTAISFVPDYHVVNPSAPFQSHSDLSLASTISKDHMLVGHISIFTEHPYKLTGNVFVITTTTESRCGPDFNTVSKTFVLP